MGLFDFFHRDDRVTPDPSLTLDADIGLRASLKRLDRNHNGKLEREEAMRSPAVLGEAMMLNGGKFPDPVINSPMPTIIEPGRPAILDMTPLPPQADLSFEDGVVFDQATLAQSLRIHGSLNPEALIKEVFPKGVEGFSLAQACANHVVPQCTDLKNGKVQISAPGPRI